VDSKEKILSQFIEIPFRIHEVFMNAAEAARELSHNGDGTRTGAVIVNVLDAMPDTCSDKAVAKKVIASGSNTLPYAMTPGLRKMINDRSTDFYHNALQHAERNAIHNVVKKRGPRVLQTSAMYTTLSPCSQCAWEIITSGIRFVISPQVPDFTDPIWGKNWLHSLVNLEMGGVKYLVWPGVQADTDCHHYLWNGQMLELRLPLEVRLESHVRRMNDGRNCNIDILAKLLRQARG